MNFQFNSFKARHKSKLSSKTANNLTRNRAGCLTPKSLADYFKILGETLENLGIKDRPENIFNCDETSFSGINRPKKVFCNKKVKAVNRISPNNEKQTYTVQVSYYLKIELVS